MTKTTRFAHHRLDAYRCALELFLLVEELAERLPRGHADLKDQVRRSAAAAVRHIAEGANRTQPKDKAARFFLARAEVGECAATLEMTQLLGLCPSDEMIVLADRIAVMATGLGKRELRRLRPG